MKVMPYLHSSISTHKKKNPQKKTQPINHQDTVDNFGGWHAMWIILELAQKVTTSVLRTGISNLPPLRKAY